MSVAAVRTPIWRCKFCPPDWYGNLPRPARIQPSPHRHHGRRHGRALSRAGDRGHAGCAPRRGLAVRCLKAAASAAEFGVPCETSNEALLARPDLDAVCICTPSGQHARETIAAARAGKRVLVKKPMALSLADADAMIEACRSAGVTLAVALQAPVPRPPARLVFWAIQDGLFGHHSRDGRDPVLPVRRPTTTAPSGAAPEGRRWRRHS